MANVIETEWALVRNVPSLYAHYETPQLYGKWRHRFIRAGFIQKTNRTWKRPVDAAIHRKEYNKTYYKAWRASHKDKVRQYVFDYWKRKLSEVRSNPENIGKFSIS